jgi:hypothetical protein
MAMDQYENVAVSAARRSVLAGGASNESGTYVKFTPVGAEMFAKADGNFEITGDAILPRRCATVSFGYTLVSRCTETPNLPQ